MLPLKRNQEVLLYDPHIGWRKHICSCISESTVFNISTDETENCYTFATCVVCGQEHHLGIAVLQSPEHGYRT